MLWIKKNGVVRQIPEAKLNEYKSLGWQEYSVNKAEKKSIDRMNKSELVEYAATLENFQLDPSLTKAEMLDLIKEFEKNIEIEQK